MRVISRQTVYHAVNQFLPEGSCGSASHALVSYPAFTSAQIVQLISARVLVPGIAKKGAFATRIAFRRAGMSSSSSAVHH